MSIKAIPFMQPYSLWSLREMREYLQNPPQYQDTDGDWRPLKPLRYISFWNDVKLGWLVFRGKAEAVTWLNIHEREDL